MFSDQDKDNYEKALARLTEKFGEIEQESREFDFDLTDYYNDEMGSRLKKKFIVFKKEIDRSELPDIKIFTNRIEDELSQRGKRTVNLDPGYITMHNLVLASAKEMPWRLYMDKGIFADLTYMFNKQGCILLDNTFPDFRKKEVQEFFVDIRKSIISDRSRTQSA